MIHQRTGGKCGVALEMDKLSHVLRRMGHNVHYCTGEGPGHLLPELHLLDPDEEELLKGAFSAGSMTEDAFREKLARRTALMRSHIEAFLDHFSIDLLIVQNIWVVLSHLGTGTALSEIASERHLPVLAHHHDFYWDFNEEWIPAHPSVESLLETHFPPDLPNLQHMVINSVQHDELMQRREISSTVLPNVIDVETVRESCPRETEDAFRAAVDLRDDDLVVMCGTRIIPHKFIEAALEIAAALNRPEQREALNGTLLAGGGRFSRDSRVVFIECGRTESYSDWYIDALKERAQQLNLETRWIGERLSGMHPMPGEDLGALFDAYCHADLITYTTVHEGWGNQLLEALAAKRPTIVFEYPIFKTDIASYGLELISIGSEIPSCEESMRLRTVDDTVVRDAASESIEILTDPEKRQRMVEHNYDILKRQFSFDRMEEILSPFIYAVSGTPVN